MNFLITGASGVLAKKIISNLLEQGHRVYAFSRTRDLTETRPGETKHLNTDLPHFNAPIDVLMHCAFTRSEHSTELSSSLEFTHEVARFCQRQAVTKIINISSQSVYSDQAHGELLDEQATLSPPTRYGLAKVAAELILNTLSSSTVITIRLGSLIGPGMEMRALHKMTLYAYEHHEIRVFDGRQFCSLVSVDDAANGIITIALTDTSTGKLTLNLTSHEQPTMLEIAQEIAIIIEQQCGFHVKITSLSNIEKLPSSLKISAEKLADIFGIKIEKSVTKTIKDIIVKEKISTIDD